jgi:outer membrane protein TolC
MPRSTPFYHRILLLASTGLLGACATLPPEAGLAGVNRLVLPQLGQPLRTTHDEAALRDTTRQVAELLREPLSADTAVRVALLNNRVLQARLAALGIAQADVEQAGRLPNPGFSFGRLARGSELEYERGLHLNLARLLTLPLAGHIEQRRFDAVQRDTAADVLALAADTRKAWVRAVAAEETVRYRRQVFDAAETGAELARRMEQVGNFNKLMRAREQGFYADAALALARAEQQQRSTRERLIRLLGLWGEQTAFVLPERLPDLPAAAREQPDIERLALGQRLDVQAARLAAERTAANLGLVRRTRVIDVFELGYVRNGSNEEPRQRGWEIALELPLFDWGSARVARAEATYMQAVHRTAAVAIDARSEVREAYANYRSAFDIARHHFDEVVPLAKRISDEQLLRYNGMLIGVFELLADARAQVAAVNAAIDALRDFWLAQADLEQALVGKATLSMPAEAGSAVPSPAAGSPGH